MDEELRRGGVVLVKDGVWQVPAEQRPANWRTLPVKEDSIPVAALIAEAESTPEPSTASMLCGCGKPVNHRAMCSVRAAHASESRKRWRLYREMAAAIEESARAMGCETHLVNAAKIIVAGLWERSINGIRRMTGCVRIRPVMNFCVRRDIWTTDGSVYLGVDHDDAVGNDLGLWLLAMAAVGEIEYCGRDQHGQATYRSIQ